MFAKIKNTLITTTLLTTVLSGSSSVSFYMSTLSMDYSEYADGRLLDTEESGFSDIYGFEISFDHSKRIRHNLSIGMEILYGYLKGDTDYTGAYLGSNEGYGSLTSTTSNTITDIYAQVYMLFTPKHSIDLKLALGYGKHEWERELSVYQVETYRWYPLGIEFSGIFHFNQRFPFDLTASVGFQKGTSSEMDINYPSATLDLGGVSCVTYSLSGAYNLNSNLSLKLEYERIDQTIDRSNVVYTSIGAIYEPDSEDTQQKLKIGLGYSF